MRTALAVRARSIFIDAAALCLGLLAAFLPAWTGVPPLERPSLRGLSLAVVGWPFAALLLGRIGFELGRERGEIEGSARLNASDDPRRLARRLPLRLLLVGLPSWLAGVEAVELSSLLAAVQRGFGSRNPLSPLVLLAAALVLVWSISSLVAAFLPGARRLRIGHLVSMAGGVLLVWIGIASLASIPAPVGTERAAKLAAMAVLATLAAAASTAVWRRAGRGWPALVLAAGLAAGGFGIVAFAVAYRSPSARSIVAPSAAWESKDSTLVESHLRGRPDLKGYFALPKVGGRVRLVSVAPGEWTTATPDLQPVEGGWVFMPPPRVPSGADSELSIPSPDTLVELRLLSTRLGRPDRGTGLFVPRQSRFHVSPDLSYAVVSYGDPERRIASPCPSPSSLLVLVERGSASPTILARGLWEPPLVLGISNDEVRILFVGDRTLDLVPALREQTVAAVDRASRASGPVLTTSCRGAPSFLTVASFQVRERLWSDRQDSANGIGGYRHLFPDRRRLLANCSAGWCVHDTDQLGNSIALEWPDRRSPGVSPSPLSNGRVAMLWYDLPTTHGLHWKLTLNEVDGRALRTVALEGSAEASFGGELEDGSIVIATHPGRSYGPGAEVFGWRVEAFDQERLTSRVLGSGLRVLKMGSGRNAAIFLDRQGRILSPSSAGMVDRLRDTRRFDPSRSSTGRVVQGVEERP